MAIVLFDQPHIRKNLLPFTYTRPVAEIRVGVFTISEKWQKYFREPVSWFTEPYLKNKFPCRTDRSNLFINGAACPDASLMEGISSLPEGTALVRGKTLLAFKSSLPVDELIFDKDAFQKQIEFGNQLTLIDAVWKIFQQNHQQIIEDVAILQKERSFHKIQDRHTVLYNEENIFVEEGVKIKAAVLNAENGPIYLAKNSEIKEGAVVRGPFALGEGSILNMCARVIGDTSIGPFCKMGGEISNVVVFGYSNKAHDGFLGNSVIGEWCNIGAATNTSNLKNNYKKVKLWDYGTEQMENTDMQFCGLLMGDHAKCGINTMFNTATVVGVGANVFGEGFPANFIPSYAWGGSKGFQTFDFSKFLEMTQVVMERRDKELVPDEINILETVFNLSARYRTWEK